jgi:hypothetical protein
MSNETYSCSCFLCKGKNSGHSKRVSKATYFRHKSYPQTIETNDSQQEFNQEVTADLYYENRYYSIKSQSLASGIV